MNVATLIAITYTVFCILAVYIVARPSNRKRVLNLTLCVINSSTMRLDELLGKELLPRGARRVLPWGMATFALVLGYYLISVR